MSEVDVPTKGGKKSIIVHLNVVPFIDMMTILVMFLLMTAVWTRTGRLTADQAVSPPNQQKKQDQKEPPKRLMILVTKNSVKVKFGDQIPKEIPVEGFVGVIKPLQSYLKSIKGQLSANQKVVVAPIDDLLYQKLIRVIDTLAGVGLNNVMVSDFESVAPQMM